MIDGRGRWTLIPGALGLVSGVIAAAADLPLLGLLAGLCAAAAAAIAVFGKPVAAPAGVPAPEPEKAPPAESPTVPQPRPQRAPERAAVSELVSDGVVMPPGHDTGSSSFLDEHGLFNEEYFRVAVEARVSAARRHLRPVAVVLFEAVEGLPGGSPTPAAPPPIVAAIKATLREADTACRLDDGRYAFVLEDTPEDGAIWTVERLRRALSERAPGQVRWAGIACYPAHAFSAEEVLTKAERAFDAAREWAQDRIEVATAD